jgi:ATP-dependent Zn protease
MLKRAKTAKIAMHEAGHAVIARRLGVYVSYVTIYSDFGAQPHAQTRSARHNAIVSADDIDSVVSGCETDAKISLAGPYAQARYQKLAIARSSRGEWRNDISNAQGNILCAVLLRAVPGFDPSLAGEYTPTDIQAEQCNIIFANISAQVNKLVQDEWSVIERTAQALLERSILTNDDIDEIIQEL